MLYGVAVVAHNGGVEFMTWLAPMPSSQVATSCIKGGGGRYVTLYANLLQCNPKNCLYIAFCVLL